MLNIRNGMFETNSSSVHSICIQKSAPDYFPDTMRFCLGEYGWEHGCVNPSDYLWTAINDVYFKCPDEIRYWKKLISDICEEHNVHPIFECLDDTINNEYWASYYDFGIDHSGDLDEFLNAMRSKETLERFIFGENSTVYTGNDNDGDMNDMCYAADDTIWEYDDGWHGHEIPNPNHDEETYEYFMKGN